MPVERRYKILVIDKDSFIGIFNHLNTINNLKSGNTIAIQLPIFPNLPKGYEIHDIIFDFEFQCFKIIIWHLSFPVVPPNMVITDLVEGGLEYRIVKIEKD
jgi:hypothetical protein